MATVMIFSLPFFSHVKPTLPLVAELLARGERVIYYSDEQYRAMFADFDVTFRSYGNMRELFVDENDLGLYLSNPQTMLEYLVPGVIQKSRLVLNAILADVMAEQPDYIVRDSDAHWGKLIGELLEVPVACYVLTFAINQALLEKDHDFLMHKVFKIKEGYAKVEPTASELNRIAAALAEKHHIQGFGLVDAFSGNEELNLVYTSKAFQPHSDVFDDRFMFIGPQFPNVSAEKLQSMMIRTKQDHELPLIYISFGSIYTDRPDFYRKCIEAFRSSEAQIIMSVGKSIHPSSLGEIPENMTVHEFVPQLEILSKADVFISHAGYNSVSEALVFGVPMILFPQGADQFAIASRLEELGVGVYVRDMNISASELSGITFETMNNEKMKAQAVKLGSSFFETGGMSEGVSKILEYVDHS
ncbi:macrolide family glycosyltransferase [Paenibacillus pabuli]|uniref:macrolide family glycosyltransferase n=1 Tax=Paenibacillus pabuli TaxID=1472 RepID=UPI0007810823|nr:macrolide family glycosyltransferase [Paenibacillus pabuli]MEC0128812.1 glycosyltransferase [Paenibacillus pabuli]